MSTYDFSVAANGSFQLPSPSSKQVFVRLSVLDTSPFLSSYQDNSTSPEMRARLAAQNTTAQLAFFNESLSGLLDAPSNVPTDAVVWQLVMGHHPIISSNVDHPPLSTEMLSQIEPLLRSHGVHAYLNGHAHMLEYLSNYAGDNVAYICSGAGSDLLSGGGPYINPSEYSRMSNTTLNGFVTVQFNEVHMNVTYWGVDLSPQADPLDGSQLKAAILYTTLVPFNRQ